MIYFPRIDETTHKDALTDIATALATGNVEIELFPFYDGTAMVTRCALKLTSDVRPSNGTVEKFILAQDDTDTVKFIPTEGKAKQGFLFVAVRDMSASDIGATTNTTLETFLNDIRQIVNGANAVIVGDINETSPGIVIVQNLYVVAYGYLKETQTEDYNPLDVINSAWVYKMFNPTLLLQ